MSDSTSEEPTMSSDEPAPTVSDSKDDEKTEEIPCKPKISDEERLELADKLDKDLENFMAGFEKRPYTDGWSEDNWEEEMSKHPFFMKEPPKPGEDIHPLYEGLQKLKYDPEENTAEELAQSYKEDGNWYMKYKKFRAAIIAYTEGLKFKPQKDLTATLYNNRSAANYFLKNYRSALMDAKKALEQKPDYLKCKNRAAFCCAYLDRFDECKTYCYELLEDDPMNEEITNLITEITQKEYYKKRMDRRFEMEQQKKQDKWEQLIKALDERKIKFFEKASATRLKEKDITPLLPPLESVTVFVQDDNSLVWPAAFAYPQFEVMDFEQELSENATMMDCLTAILENCEYDSRGVYKPENVNVYYENKQTGTTHLVDKEKTIAEIVQDKTFLVVQGTLMFFICLKDSGWEKKFLEQERKAFDRYGPVV